MVVAPSASGVFVVGTEYQVSGSALITRSAGFSRWPRKNQCHHAAANSASHRSSASTIGVPSSTASRVTRSGWSSAVR